MPTYTKDEHEKSETPVEELLEKARKCFKLAQESEQAQRRRENDDLKFQVPDLQWDDAAKRQRTGTTISGVPVPPRPILSISKIDQPIQLIMNQARAANLGVNIHPVSEDADKEGAEIRQGLYRRIERDSNANQARLWALDRATKAGRGVYRIDTKWDEDAPEASFDQEIVIERILHQESVYFDPAATKPDFSDAEWAFQCQWLAADEFKRRFPDADLSKTDDDDKFSWADLQTQAPEWVRETDKGRDYLVADYWYKEHEIKNIKGPDGLKRKRDIVSVKLATCCASNVLEVQDWPGKYIPLVLVIGKELQPFDSQRRWVGMIAPSKDGQRMYNFAASTLVERMALEPKTPFVGTQKQFEGFEDMWQQANTRSFAFLPVNSDPAAPGFPQRVQVDQSGMSLAMMALQEADHFIQATTAVYDPSLGRDNPRDKSGKAILALQQQSDAGTSQYLSSLADISMPYEARVILDLMPKIYDRPGRVTTILRGDDDQAEPIMLNAPFVKGPDGRPMPVQPGQMPPGGGQKPLEYDLSKGAYSVSIDIGKSFQTRLQQGQDEIGQILSASPDLMPIIGDLYFKFRDFPGAPEIAKRLAKIREQSHPGLDEGDQQQSAEQAQAKLQGMQAQMQQMQQQLQQAGQAIQTDQAKQQGQIEIAKINAGKELKLQEMRDATSIAVAQINAQSKGVLSASEAANEALATGLQQQHDAHQAAEDRAHQVAMAAVGHAQGRQGAAEDSVLGEAGPEAPEAPEPTQPMETNE